MPLFGWDFGTVPQWVSAASVPAALYIIGRDRRAQRFEQALSVSAWRTSQIGPDGLEILAHVHNASKQPIFYPKISLFRDQNDKLLHSVTNFYDPPQQGLGAQAVPALMSGETTYLAFAFDPKEPHVIFHDARGRGWTRDAVRQKLYADDPRTPVALWRRSRRKLREKNAST